MMYSRTLILFGLIGSAMAVGLREPQALELLSDYEGQNDGSLSNYMMETTPQGHTARTTAYAKMHELARARSKALSAYKKSLKAPVVDAQADDHTSQGADYKKMYEDAQARYEQQKKDCANCDTAEVALIAALTLAKDKHTTAQSKSDLLATATTAYSDAKSAWDAKKLAFSTKAATLNCGALTVGSTASAFDGVVTITNELKALAAEETALETATNNRKAELDNAQAAYDAAKALASSSDTEVTTLTAGRDTACAALNSVTGGGGSGGGGGALGPKSGSTPALVSEAEGLTAVGAGTWYGGPARKINGQGYKFHPENMVKNWVNGCYDTSWIGKDCGYQNDCPNKLWFVLDLGEKKWIDTVKLWPQSPCDTYRSSEYEILISDAAPADVTPDAFGPEFATASAGYTQVATNSPWGATNQEYTHAVNTAGRYVMFHATNWNSNSPSDRFDGLRSAGVKYLHVQAQPLA